jgi:hypothetical protein
MARGGTAKETAARRELPAALPPGQRTVGQLVAETIRFYQHAFWRGLALGVLPGVASVAAAELSGWHRYVFAIALAPVFTVSYVAACALVGAVSLRGASALRAFVAGLLVYIPFPFLTLAFVLPGLAWFALFGMVVPAALIEGLGLRASFARALRLGRADFVHALGGLSALAVVVVLSQGVVFYFLRSFADNAASTAAALAGVVFSPLLFIGAAILYGDQVARLRSDQPRSRRPDAHVPDADNAHREGRADAQVEPGPSA